MALDPTIAVAIVTGATGVLSAGVAGTVAILSERLKKSAQKEAAEIARQAQVGDRRYDAHFIAISKMNTFLEHARHFQDCMEKFVEETRREQAHSTYFAAWQDYYSHAVGPLLTGPTELAAKVRALQAAVAEYSNRLDEWNVAIGNGKRADELKPFEASADKAFEQVKVTRKAYQDNAMIEFGK